MKDIPTPCPICGESDPRAFNRAKGRNTGWQYYCKKCAARYTNERRSQQRKAMLQWMRSGGCVSCGEQDEDLIDLHHVEQADKEFGVTSGRGKSVTQWNTELAKTIPLCVTCHRLVHRGRIDAATLPRKSEEDVWTQHKNLLRRPYEGRPRRA